MSIPQAVCPDCSAKLSSKAGFTAGQKIKCPKCDTVFAVPAPKKKPVVLDEDEDERPAPKKKAVIVDDEDEDERPRKKKKGKKAAEGGYANSPLRFVILGVLVVTMLVMGYFLYRKFTAPPVEVVVPNRLDQE